MGRATAELLAAQGVKVAVFDVNGDVPVDVRDAESIARGVDEVRRSLGPVDILVNAAGIAAGGPIDGEHYVETWQRTLAVNLTGAMLTVRACLEDLRRSRAGRIVNVASTEALGAARHTSPYTVSKHGLLGFTRSLAVDLGRSGVTANCVCPGAIRTPMVQTAIDQGFGSVIEAMHPIGRIGEPIEVAEAVLWLCSDQASFVTGHPLAVDGGALAR